MKNVAFHNLGCKVNAYEMEIIQQKFVEAGYQTVPFDSKADIYIINTCTVTNIADRKSRQMLHRAKKMNPKAIVVAVGCYVQTDTDNARKDEAIDIIIGNNRKSQTFEIVSEYIRCQNAGENRKTVSESVIDINADCEYEAGRLETTLEHTRAYIKIQDGCNQFCSYCIIPFARGRIRSRELSDILEEVEGLASKGYKEIVLTGIHLSSYGLDFISSDSRNISASEEQNNNYKEDNEQAYKENNLKPKSYNELAAEGEYTNLALMKVIKEISEIEGIKRIRLGSLEPRIITEEFLKLISSIDKICPHFHLSLQSGSDTVLKRMNRQYSAKEYYEKVLMIRDYFEHPAITTDVIVGFPGESDAEFDTTRDYLNQVDFYEAHIFKYSRRKGTLADKMPEQLTDKVKSERSTILIKDSEKRSRIFREYYLGKDIEVLFEENQVIDDKDYYVGYTKEYVKVAYASKEDVKNQIIKGRITDSLTDEILVFSNPVS